MVTVSACVLEEELRALREVAAARGWVLELRSETSFVLGMRARDGSMFWLLVLCDRYPSVPSAWQWYNHETGAVNEAKDTPKGGGFFHGSGRICAPWNRFAYKSEDAMGPHSDWDLAAWPTNPKTGQCKSLAAMALRIYVELQKASFAGRLA